MSTATTRIGNTTATRMRQEHFAHSNPGAIALDHNTERALTGRHAHREWMRGLDDAWQIHLRTLREYVRELVIKNQPPRFTPSAVSDPKWKFTNAGNF